MVKDDFNEKWIEVMKRYEKRKCRDEGIKSLEKRRDRLLKKVQDINVKVWVRQTTMLAEEVKKMFVVRHK